jgi:DNA repair exonuclease SbcCD nuclease subunit
MRYLFIADSHLGINKSNDFYHEVVYTLFDEITEVCTTRDINTIVHLGDFFHERKALNTKTQSIAHGIAHLLQDFTTYILIGNHDIYFKDKLYPTALELFKKYEHIYVIDKQYEMDELVLVPWGILPEADTFGAEYCVGHFNIVGFQMNNYFKSTSGLDPKVLKDFKHVYSGHFHTPSSHGNITYLGSPYPHTFNDIDSRRGYYIWENGDLEFIEFKSAPKFRIIHTSTINKDEIRGNHVRLVFDEDYGSIQNQQVIDEVWQFKPYKLHPDFSGVKIEGTEERLEETEASLLDHDEIIKEYIRKTEFPPTIRESTLLSMIEKLREED